MQAVGTLNLVQKVSCVRDLRNESKLILGENVVHVPLVFKVANESLPMVFACGWRQRPFSDRPVKGSNDSL